MIQQQPPTPTSRRATKDRPITSNWEPTTNAATERTDFLAEDRDRARTFRCTLWKPSGTEPRALILYSHHSGGCRDSATYLCQGLASHGYTVASLDHSDTQLPRPSEATTDGERAKRLDTWIASRVPDMRFLLKTVGETAAHVGVVGHSFGGWTALATPDEEPRIDAVVALAPAGARNPRPGIIPAKLDFAWHCEVPTLVIAAEYDVSVPLENARDVYDRIPGRKRLVVLPMADHLHFVDDAQGQHECVRATQFPPELSWMRDDMRPFSTLLGEDEAHRRIAAETLAHFDAAWPPLHFG